VQQCPFGAVASAARTSRESRHGSPFAPGFAHYEEAGIDVDAFALLDAGAPAA